MLWLYHFDVWCVCWLVHDFVYFKKIIKRLFKRHVEFPFSALDSSMVLIACYDLIILMFVLFGVRHLFCGLFKNACKPNNIVNVCLS